LKKHAESQMSEQLPAEMEKLNVSEQLDENGQPLSKNALKKLEKAKKVAEEKAAKEAAKAAKAAEQGGSEKKKVRNMYGTVVFAFPCIFDHQIGSFTELAHSRDITRASFDSVMVG